MTPLRPHATFTEAVTTPRERVMGVGECFTRLPIHASVYASRRLPATTQCAQTSVRNARLRKKTPVRSSRTSLYTHIEGVLGLWPANYDPSKIRNGFIGGATPFYCVVCHSEAHG